LEQAYAEAIRRGFLGPREQERLRERHLDDALGLAAIRRPTPGEHWADLGSGAGLPGLPLAVAHRATSFTMIDAQRRRLDWIEETAAKLHLINVKVVHARLEDYGRGAARESFHVATARALGPLPVVAELGLPLLAVGGQLLIPRGQPDNQELAETALACEQLGGRTMLSPTRARRLTGSVSSLSWQRSLRPPPASPGDRVCRRELRSASCAIRSAS
jgi:16S rRNA (guanine527-N7)-methyltransferase